MMRALLIGMVAFMLWASASAYWYLCQVQEVWCPGETEQVEEKKPLLPPQLALLDELGDTVGFLPGQIAFLRGSSDPILPEDSLLLLLVERLDQQLESDSLGYLMISGLYDPEQEGDSLFPGEVVAAERAVKIKALLSGLGIPEDFIETEIGEEVLHFQKDGLSWSAIEISLLQDPEPVEIPVPELLQSKQMIFFSYAKPLLESVPEAIEFIRLTATYLRLAPHKKVRVIGFTDDTASKEANYRLGLKRALVIQGLLIEAGVAPEQVEALSLGEAQPIGNNNTREGRAKNRRVEMEIIN